MLLRTISTLIFLFAFSTLCLAQEVVPIENFSLNSLGQPQLEITGEADKYYLLTAQHAPNFVYESVVSMTMGVEGPLTISEPGHAYPQQNYEVTAYSIADPGDSDGDGIDDITEFNDMPTNAPLNFAEAVDFIDGTTSIPDAATFASMAVVADVPWAPFLNGQQFVKFGILDVDTDEPKVYFINSNTHFIHAAFFGAIGANVNGDDGSGEVVFNPNDILPNGSIGSYSFNFSFGDAKNFETTQRTFELLMANMPFLRNNFQHFIGDGGESIYNNQYADDYEGSRIDVVLESDVFSDVDYIPFNKTEGYGFFRHMQLDENPNSRDIVLYDALPNSLPRVGGIITSVVQTPLSHVNLRAIQDNVPNAYIRDPLSIDTIANLLGSFIYYRVDDDEYFIREATIEEVNDWYEDLRPTQEQIPERDLSQTNILPLDSIRFEMSTAFGAKCSNVATMRTFGFPEGTIPDGFGIPFYYYDEFMKFNNFYDDVEDMISDSDFINDLETRIDMLKDFRNEIKDAPMPQWMLDDLQAMHDAFPEGTAVRCRSSTNNEDLPGFSGAGLYTSKTQHLDEGHISKSIKQVYASMWNFRAFDERDFYRVDHYIAAMGILCHSNFQEEKSNGVGVSIDPVFETENTFYLNTQVGEFLITNPDANSIPEEILLNQDPAEGFVVLRESNLVPTGELVMDEQYLDLMREYLQVIHDEFAILYNVVGAEGFGMDIEYKVTAEDQLIIKQARPWVSFWADIKATFDLTAVEITEPISSASLSDSELVTVNIGNRGLNEMEDFEIALIVDDVLVETLPISGSLTPQTEGTYQFTTPQDFSTVGDYHIQAIVSHPTDGYEGNDTSNLILSKLHLLESGISLVSGSAKCGAEVDVIANITNYGESNLDEIEIEVVVNGEVVEVVNYDFNIPYQGDVEVVVTVTENLEIFNNEIILNVISINGQADAIPDNNSITYNTDLTTDFENITLVIQADNWPQEISWQLINLSTNVAVSTGSLDTEDDLYMEDICVNYSSCFSLQMFDSFGDGICCQYGEGNFFILNSSGDTLDINDGEFTDQTEEIFCPNGLGCAIAAEVFVTEASDETANDGAILINLTSGIAPFLYSIDNGQTFFEENIFNNLAPGDYNLMVVDGTGDCTYEELIMVELDFTSDVEDLTAGSIKVYPNPTKNDLIIEIGSSFAIPGPINIELYDYLGRTMQTTTISGSESKTVLSLGAYAPGCYFAKCYNENFEEYFKVIKVE